MTSSDSAALTPAKVSAKDPWDLPEVSGLVVGVLGETSPTSPRRRAGWLYLATTPMVSVKAEQAHSP
jgi:hypothetical protein